MNLPLKDRKVVTAVAGVIVLAVILIVVLALASLKPDTGKSSDDNVPPAGAIDIYGQVVCLPHKNTDGPTTLECAFGLQDEQGRYYALRDTDINYENVSGAPMNTRVLVKGIFTPEESEIYQSIGRIDVTDIVVPETPQRTSLEGEYVCLPHRDTEGPQTDECAFGLLTDDGLYYALDLNLISQEIPEMSVGDRIYVSGVLTPIEMISSNQWAIYNVEGIMSVTDSVKNLSE